MTPRYGPLVRIRARWSGGAIRSWRFVFFRRSPLGGLRAIRYSETAQFMEAVKMETATPCVESFYCGFAFSQSVTWWTRGPGTFLLPTCSQKLVR
jgi:hypothetical protein